MSIFDVRNSGVDTVTEIVFADNNNGYGYPYKITRSLSTEICLEDGEDYNVSILTKDIPNLIAALQKAIELGWAKPATKEAKTPAKKPLK